MKLGEWIHSYRVQNNMSMADFAKRSGVSKAYIGFLEKGQVNPTTKMLSKIASSLNLTLQELLSKVDGDTVVTIPASIPYSLYPFIEAPISAGALESVDAINELPKVSVPDSFIGKYARGHDIVFMRVNGESMNNVIENHTVIAVQTGLEKEQLTNGDIVIACNHGEYTVKHFIDDEQNRRIILRPDSSDPAFSDIIIPYEEADEFSIFGKVVVYAVML